MYNSDLRSQIQVVSFQSEQLGFYLPKSQLCAFKMAVHTVQLRFFNAKNLVV